MERAYLERVNKFILKEKALDNEAKVLGAVGGLKINTKVWRNMLNIPHCMLVQIAHQEYNAKCRAAGCKTD